MLQHIEELLGCNGIDSGQIQKVLYYHLQQYLLNSCFVLTNNNNRHSPVMLQAAGLVALALQKLYSEGLRLWATIHQHKVPHHPCLNLVHPTIQ